MFSHYKWELPRAEYFQIISSTLYTVGEIGLSTRSKGTLFLKEMADTLFKSYYSRSIFKSLNSLVIPILPASKSVIGARFKRKTMFEEFSLPSIINTLKFQHLNHRWNSKICHTCAVEVAITRLRCRTPYRKFYLHRAGLAAPRNCWFCGLPETTDHYLIYCKNRPHCAKSN